MDYVGRDWSGCGVAGQLGFGPVESFDMPGLVY